MPRRVALLALLLAGACFESTYAPPTRAPVVDPPPLPPPAPIAAPRPVRTTPPCDVGDAAGCKLRCSAGDAASCNNLGVTYERTGSETGIRRARAAFVDACRARSADGCANAKRVAALQAERSIEAQRSVATCAGGSVQDCRQACGDGDGIACEQLGMIYMTGKRVPVDRTRAEEAFEQACAAGNAGLTAGGCLWLGLLYKPNAGLGTPEQARKAAGYFTKACDAGADRGCTKLVEMMREQTYAPSASELTALLGHLEMSCGYGDGTSDACQAVQRIADDRLFGDDTRPAVLDTLTRLCEGGNAALCKREQDLATE